MTRKGDWIRRIQWANSGDAKITIYDANGVFCILRDDVAFAFTRVILEAFRAADEAQKAVAEATSDLG